jgi:hypothetical protein
MEGLLAMTTELQEEEEKGKRGLNIDRGVNGYRYV